MKTIKNFLSTSGSVAAVFSAATCGILTHFYGLVNTIHGCDDIAQQPYGYGTGITSGRWFLTGLGDFVGFWGGNYNLPFVNGVLFILIVAISAGFLVSALKIQKKSSCILIGILFVVFPSATSTLYFRYTSVYYGIGLLLAVIAAWVLEKGHSGMLLSALCLAFSLGLYQAYAPMTIGIFVLQLLRLTMDGKQIKELIYSVLSMCASLILGLLLYFLFLKIFLWLYNTSLSDYQGIDSMGKIVWADLPKLIKEAAYSVCMFPVKDYCGLAGMRLIKLSYLLLNGVSVFSICYIIWKLRKIGTSVIVLLLCAIFPIAVNFIVIMCPDSWIYTLMVYSFVLIPCVPFVVAECIPFSKTMTKCNRMLTKFTALLVSTIIFCYSYEANISYTSMFYANRQVENYLNSIVVQVRMTEGFDKEKEWAFIGDVEDPMLRSYWQYENRYGGNEDAQSLLNRYSRYEWLRNYIGYSPPLADEKTLLYLCQREEIQAMPCWPDEGSIKVIDNWVVIKFQDHLGTEA
ncbi:MAG: glucosyltransferase domain-containing protein [Eubacteriales bacterium]|nr:glucosyltransferase domain-containing protein [Eubacteriales bacterium]